MKNTLYLIHGWTYTTKYWQETIKYLEKMGIKVQMLQVPGLTTKSDKIFTIQDYTKWVKKSLPQNATVLGHSNGGRILLNLLKDQNHPVKHLILLNSAGIFDPSKKAKIAKILSQNLQFLKKIPLLRKIIHKILRASDYSRAPENMKQTLTNMLESDQDLDLTRLYLPPYVDVIWGKKDQITPLKHGEIIAKSLNAKLEVHNDWDHAPYIKHPKSLAKAIFNLVKNQ